MTAVKRDTQGLEFTLNLGTAYEKKKEQLKQELRLNYMEYVGKKTDEKRREPHLQQGLSLPIDERVSIKERLREERSREYNLFLQEQANIKKLKRAAPAFTSKPEQVQMPDAERIISLDTHENIPSPHKERPASRRDVATLTEAIDNGRNTGAWGPGPWTRRRWHIRRPEESQSSAEELNTEEEKELDFRTRRRQGRWPQEPEYRDERKTHDHHVNRCNVYSERASQDITEMDPPVVQNNNERIWKSCKDMPDDKITAARSTSLSIKDNAEFATGLMIGTVEEPFVTQMRKKKYRQELLSQIAEKRRNKIQERKLEMRVAATGATDPEKESDLIKRFGAAYQQYGSLRLDGSHKTGRDLGSAGRDPNSRPKNGKCYENIEHGAPGRLQADFSTALSKLPENTVPGAGVAHAAPAFDFFHEDYHRDSRSMLGEVAIQRVAGVAPPAPPIVPNTCRPPDDAAHSYYGTRDPLHPNSLQNQNSLHGRAQQSGISEISPQISQYIRANGSTEASPIGFERFPVDPSKQRKDSTLAYQESLRQQMKEREERKRREREEVKRFDAKIEAEMMAYNPWGRGGAGAPIKDQNGNLVTDLNQMHRNNNCSMFSPGAEGRTPFFHQISGSRHHSPAQQLQNPEDMYRGELRQQIEERKRKKAEEREQLRIAEEKEEERFAKERAQLQLQYEEEQRKQKMKNTKERKEHKRSEEEEVKGTDVKLEAEVMPNNPLGTGGAGAPMKDQNGNLVSDLNQMHRNNSCSMFRPGAEGRTPFSHKPSGSRHHSPAQQLQNPEDMNREKLKQIEERKRKKAEEREQLRIAEEKEEERFAKERARLQLQYEEEQRKQKMKNKVKSVNPKTRYKEKLKCEGQEKETIPKSTCEKDEKNSQLINERAPSPPIPTLQRKQKNVVISRPSSAVSELSPHLSSRTEQSTSAPDDRPVAERIPTLNDGQKQVIKELSGLRRYLKKEQRRLELQMDQTGPQETCFSLSNRRRPRVDTFENPHKEAVGPSAKSPFPGALRVNKENIKEFNQLKYRDTVSYEKVGAASPDPPSDTKGLDIHQQALLREQQHKIRLKNRQRAHDCFKGDADEQVYRQGTPQHSAEHSVRAASRRRLICEDISDSVGQREQDNPSDNQSVLPFKVGSPNQQLNTRQPSEHGDHNSKSGLIDDEDDDSSLRSTPGRCVSVATVATEPWLRPGTSDVAKRCREKPNIRMDAAP